MPVASHLRADDTKAAGEHKCKKADRFAYKEILS